MDILGGKGATWGLMDPISFCPKLKLGGNQGKIHKKQEKGKKNTKAIIQKRSTQSKQVQKSMT